jgi:hypothetical protein
LAFFSTAAANILYFNNATGRIGMNTTSAVGRLTVDDRSFIGSLPLNSSNLLDVSTFRPHTRFQNTVGSNNNGLSMFSTIGAWGMQSHDYLTGAALPYILQPAGGNVGIGTALPANALEIRQGTAGNSGLRFTNLTSASAANTSLSKVLSVNATGDVILTNVPGTQNIVEFQVNGNPNTAGTTFLPNTPNDQTVIYQSTIDNSLWTFNGTAYVTYMAPSSTAWFTAGTTNDAGNSKTANIYRTGNVGIGTTAPTTLLTVGTFDDLNTTKMQVNGAIKGNANGRGLLFLDGLDNQIYRGLWGNFGLTPATHTYFQMGGVNTAFTGVNGVKMNSTKMLTDQFQITTGTALDTPTPVGVFEVRNATTPFMNVLASGNVGIGTTTPGGRFVVNHNAYIAALPATSPNLMDNTTFRPLSRFQTTFGINNNAISHYMTTTAAATQVHTFSTGATLPYILQPAGGNVGIGTGNIAPVTTLQVNGSMATATIQADAQLFRMMRPQFPGFKWENIAQFNLGSYTTGNVAANSRLDLVMNDGGGPTLSNIMTWQANGNVGIGTTSPISRLDVISATSTDVARFTTSLTGTNYAGIGIGNASGIWGKIANGENKFQIRNFSTDAVIINAELGNGNVGIGTTSPTERLTVATAPGTTANVGVYSMPLLLPTPSDITTAQLNLGPRNDFFGSIRSVLPTGSFGLDLSDIQIATGQASNNNTQVPRLTVKAITGNVGVGTTNPGSRLEVNGSATNTTAFNAAAGTTINFANSNLAYTTASPGAFVIQGMKDGGTYTLAVQGTTSGTASFSGSNPANAAFTFLSVNNGATIAGKQTLYTFIVMGTTVYFYMATGF